MKYLSWLLGVLVTVVVAIYVMAFTPFGNNILKPIIEAKIQEQTHLNSKLKLFRLSMSDFKVVLELNKNNTIEANGKYKIFSKSFDILYNVKLEELKTLKKLTSTQLQGSFETNGTVFGDIAFLTVNGDSNVAKSNTKYKVELTDFNPTSIIAKVKSLDLASLLYMLNQKSYASAGVDLNLNFKNITPHALDGNVVLQTKEGSINTKVMKQDFNITIPKTAFAMNLDAKLKGDDIDYTYLLKSNLAKISSSGNVIAQPLKTDIKYGIDIKELAVLKPMTGADIRGSVKIKGTLKGDKKNLVLKGLSNIAKSDTSFEAVLKDFAPKSIKARMRHLNLAKLLYMVKQPHYADALFDLDADISSIKSGALKGTVLTHIKNGIVDTKYITRAYKFKTRMPRTTFSANTRSVLDGNLIDTKVDVISSLATLNIKKARANIKDGSLNSDYIVKVPKLDKLYFATERHLRGAIVANGELHKAKDLDFTMHSNIAGGKLDIKLHNDDFHADLNSMQTLDILHILIYPEMFKSSLNGVLDYNLVKQNGTFNATLKDGRFMHNQVLDLVKQFGKVNLYVQKFKGDLNANIHKENIIASLDLLSNTSSIKTKNTKLNSKTKRIDSKIDIVANKHPLSITLKGSVTKPHVSVDAKKILEKEAGKVIKKQINKLFKGLF